MLSRPLQLLALFILLALGLWWVFSGPSTPPLQGTNPDAAKVEQEIAAGTLSPEALGGASSVVSEIEREKILQGALERAEIDTSAKGAQVTVLTIARDGGLPLANTEVWLLSDAGESLAELREMGDLYEAILERLSEKGKTWFSDAEGKVQMTIPEGRFYLVARSGELYAELYRNHAEDGQIFWLQLHQDHDLRVRVIDERGEPLANFPLALDFEHADWTQRLAQFSSDANGLAVLDHVEARIPSQDAGTRLIVRAEAPFREAPEIALDLEDFPDEFLYQVPPYASVTLVPMRADGEEGWREETFLQRHQEQQDQWSEVFGADARPDMGMGRVTAFRGEADYPFVGLGLELDAGVQFGIGRLPTVKTFAGPFRSGENLRVEVQEVHASPLLVLRAVNEAGEPFAHADVDLHFRLTGANFRYQLSERIHLDADGRGECPITIGQGEGVSGSMVIDLSLPVVSPDLRAKIEIEQELAPGPYDAGEVIFSKGPVLCSGQVVNRAGEPVHGVRLRLMHQTAGGFWQTLNRQVYPVNEQAQFSIHGESATEDLLLVARHPSYPHQEMEVRAGSQGVSFVMEEGYRVSGQVRFDAAVNPTNLRVFLATADIPAAGFDRYWELPAATLQQDGSFSVLTLDPNARQVLLIDEESSAILASVPDVIPWSASSNGDPRLQSWDLRDQVFRYFLRFRDSEDLPVNGVDLTIQSVKSLASGSNAQATFHRGFGELYLPERQLSFFAVGSGTTSLNGTCPQPGEYAFTLDKGISVEVQLNPYPKLQNNQRLELVLDLASNPERSASYWMHNFDADGKITVAVPDPGEYQAYLRVHLRQENGSMVTFDFPESGPKPIWTIDQQSTVQSFVLDLDVAALQAAIDERLN